MSNQATYHESEAATIGLWQLDGDLSDDSGNGHTLTRVQGGDVLRYCAGPDPDRQGIQVRANGRFETSADAAFEVTGALTFMCQARIHYRKRPGTNFGDRHILWMEGTDMVFAIRHTDVPSGQGLELWWQNGGTEQAVAPASEQFVMLPWRWYHIAATRNAAGTDAKMYLDGQEIASATGLSPVGDASGANVALLGDPAGGNQWNGALATCHLIGRELSASEVLAAYEKTSPHHPGNLG